jgi:Zn-dependent peptidase ImmA (M78 family)/DNA-binding XRE family transcriptional regulator
MAAVPRDEAPHRSGLWVARSFRRLSVNDLAEQSGVSRRTISAIENGATRSFPLAIAPLASALRFPQEFVSKSIFVPTTDVLHFRKGARVPEYEMAHAISHAALFLTAAGAFKSFAKFKAPILPSMDFRDAEAIERAAEAFRSRVGFSNEAPIVHTIRAAEAAGVFVTEFTPGEFPIHGFAFAAPEPTLMISSQSSWARKRFSCMHELGHLIAHQGVRSSEEVEGEANRFAGAALVPRAAFWREFPRPSRTRFDWAALIEMKQRWGMSIQALVGRARDLGIISVAQHHTAFRHISRNGWRTVEPAECEPERPDVCKRFVSTLDSRGEAGALCRAMSFYFENIAEVLDAKLEHDNEENSRVLPLTPRLQQDLFE